MTSKNADRKTHNDSLASFCCFATPNDPASLFLYPNHTYPDRFALTFWIFQTCFLSQFFSFERLRQRCEFAVFESEKQPLFDGLSHFSFIIRRGQVAQAATGDPRKLLLRLRSELYPSRISCL